MPSIPSAGILVAMAIVILVSNAAPAIAALNVSLPLVEPPLPSGQRSLLGDLALALAGDGGRVDLDTTGRRLLEADADVLNRSLASQSLTVTAVTAKLLQTVANDSQLAFSQPLTPLDACLVWRRRTSADTAAVVKRDGLYFVTLFHSSVWSMLLLCLLCAVFLLTILESAHPIGMRRSLARLAGKRRGRDSGRPLSPFHSFSFALGALLLVGYPRGPKSTSGRVLALFWWMFGFAIAIAYLSATLLVFLTTRSDPDQAVAPVSASLAEVLRQPDIAGRTVFCSAGALLCDDGARPESLRLANFVPVANDSAGLERLRAGDDAGQLLLTHQFACANLLALDAAANGTYSAAVLSRALAWISLAGPVDLVHQADTRLPGLLGSGHLAGLAEQHGLGELEVSSYSSSVASLVVGDWLTELRNGLPYRIGSLYGPLVLLLSGFGLAVCTAVCEFCYYRFYYEEEADDEDSEEDQAEREEGELKSTGTLSVAGTLDTYL